MANYTQIGKAYWEVSDDGMPLRRVSEEEFYKNNPDSQIKKIQDKMDQVVKEVETGTNVPSNALSKRQADEDAAQAVKDIENAKRRREIQKKYNLGDKFKLREENIPEEPVKEEESVKKPSAREAIKQELAGENSEAAKEVKNEVKELTAKEKIYQKFMQDSEKEIKKLESDEKRIYQEGKDEKRELRIAKILGNLINAAAYLTASGKRIGKAGAKLELEGIDISDQVAEVNEDVRQQQQMLRNQVSRIKELREKGLRFDTDLEEDKAREKEKKEAAEARANEKKEAAKARMKEMNEKEIKALRKESRVIARNAKKAILSDKDIVDGDEVDGEALYNKLIQNFVPEDEAKKLAGFEEGFIWDSWTSDNNKIDWGAIEKSIGENYAITMLGKPAGQGTDDDVGEASPERVSQFPNVDPAKIRELELAVKNKQMTGVEATQKLKELNEASAVEEKPVEEETLTDNTDAKELIKAEEGFRENPYDDGPDGGKSIGYGRNFPKGEGVPEAVTKEEAERMLDEDVKQAEVAIERLVKVPLNAEQKTALTSFIYNRGYGTFQNSSVLEKLNAGDYEGAADELLKYDGGGALSKRRARERKLFLGE